MIDEIAAPVRARIRAERAGSADALAILDDDPTGSQNVHDVPVITSWADEDLDWAFSQPASAFFVLTNSRSLNPPAAAHVVSEVVDALDRAAARHGRHVDVVLRGDSTLRGHFPLESDVVAEHAERLEAPYDAVVLVPAYPEAGRVTRDDVHFVTSGETLVPVGLSEYARDATFGFTSSDLRDYVEEKSRGRTLAQDVSSIGLNDIRLGGAGEVARILEACRDRRHVVVNATTDADLDVVALGFWMARRTGWRGLIRCGPPFVGSLLGIEQRPPLRVAEILPLGPSGHGLVVVGSHVPLTGAQLDVLLARRQGAVTMTVLNVPRLVGSARSARGERRTPSRAREIARCVDSVVESLGQSDAVLATSRIRVDGKDAEASLHIAGEVSRALVEVVARVVASAVPLKWVVSKGGVTSSDVATKALGIRRAVILGQMLPGQVSVWSSRAGDEQRQEGMPYVVFAGNVGGPTSLADVIDTLGGPAPTKQDWAG